MNISNKKQSNKKKLLLSVLAAIVILAAAGTTYYIFSYKKADTNGARPANTVDYSPAKPSDKIGDNSKDQIAKESPETPAPQPPSTPESLSVTITNTSQDSNMVYVRAISSNATSGECTLTLTHGTTTVTKKAPVGVQANYGNCQGFNVPKSELGASGTWQVNITVTSGSATGSARGSLEVS